MKRAVNDPRHVGVASLLYRSGIAQRLRRRFPMPDRITELRRSARSLLLAGLIDGDQHDEISRAINRQAAADFLRQLRKAEPFNARNAMIRKVREVCPVGLSHYQMEMGYARP
jgi:hypothetical protein